MNANENNNTNTIQNQEVYEGVKQVMLQEEVIPKEVIRYSEEVQEKKRLEEMQKEFKVFLNPINITTQSIESIGKQYPILKPIITPIKIIVKKAGLPFEIIDLILEYQINGDKGILIKIGGKIIETIIFSVGVSIALAISAAVASYFASMTIAVTIVGFVVFAGIAGLTIWISNQSKEISNFIYEHIYLPTKDTYANLQNGFNSLLSGNWFNDFFKITLFNNPETKQILQHELINKYGDEEVDDMDELERNYRMLLGR